MGNNPNATEDLGYAYMQRLCARAEAIWRRWAEKDVGVDGVIELRRSDGASHVVGVQVKSGASYLSKPRADGCFRLYLGDALSNLFDYTLPIILVVYDPTSDCGYWASVKRWGKDHPTSLKKGTVDVAPLDGQEFFANLRDDSRIVHTPHLPSTRIREFLEINRAISFVAFVELARHALNTTTFRCRTGIPEIDFLRTNHLLDYEEAPEGGPGTWRPTEKGREYVEFMLGDRYFLPIMLIQPSRPIQEDDVEMCQDFAQYMGNLRNRP